MIQVRGLSARHGLFRIVDVSLTVPTGGSFALLGPSGAGKTLVLETILGLRSPDAGTVLLDGLPSASTPPEQRSASWLPQDLALFPHLGVRDNVAFPLAVRGVPAAAATEAVEATAALLRIGHLLDRPDVTSLSGGEKQRVALARALVGRPAFLFLDEPFSALDVATRRELHLEVRRIQRDLGLTMVLVTHDLEEALVVADHLAILRDGRLVQTGPPDEVVRAPRDAWTARFLGYENVLDVETTTPGDGLLRLRLGEAELLAPLAVAEGDVGAVAVRAIHLHLSPDACHGGSPPQSLTGTAGAPQRFGSALVLPVRFAAGPQVLVALTERDREAPPSPGSTCTVHYSPDRVAPLKGGAS